jgi:hypothetical protein
MKVRNQVNFKYHIARLVESLSRDLDTCLTIGALSEGISREECHCRTQSEFSVLVESIPSRPYPWKSQTFTHKNFWTTVSAILPFHRSYIYFTRLMKTYTLPTAVTYLLPGLIPDKSLPNEANPITKAYFSAGLQTPLVFHALVYTGSNHLDYLRSSTIYPNAPTPLFHKTIVIQKLKEALSDPDPRQALTDEVIVGILALATQEVYMTKDEKPSPFIAPLPDLGWLNIYTNFKIVPQHAKAIADIIAIRGGLETIKLYKLAEIIIAYRKTLL